METDSEEVERIDETSIDFEGSLEAISEPTTTFFLFEPVSTTASTEQDASVMLTGLVLSFLFLWSPTLIDSIFPTTEEEVSDRATSTGTLRVQSLIFFLCDAPGKRLGSSSRLVCLSSWLRSIACLKGLR